MPTLFAIDHDLSGSSTSTNSSLGEFSESALLNGLNFNHQEGSMTSNSSSNSTESEPDSRLFNAYLRIPNLQPNAPQDTAF